MSTHTFEDFFIAAKEKNKEILRQREIENNRKMIKNLVNNIMNQFVDRSYSYIERTKEIYTDISYSRFSYQTHCKLIVEDSSISKNKMIFSYEIQDNLITLYSKIVEPKAYEKDSIVNKFSFDLTFPYSENEKIEDNDLTFYNDKINEFYENFIKKMDDILIKTFYFYYGLE